MASFPQLIEEHLSQRAAEGQTAEHLRTTRQRLEDMLAQLKKRGVRKPADVTPADLHRVMVALHQRGLKRTTRRHYAYAIRGFFRELRERGLIIRDPSLDLPLPPDALDGLPPAPLEEEVIQALFDRLPRASVADLRNRVHLELCYSQALRLGESVALDVDDLDLGRKTLHVRQAKNHRERVLPLMRSTEGALRDYLAVRRELLRGPDHGALLLAQGGNRITPITFRKYLQRLTRRYLDNNTRLYPHLLRHSAAVHMLRGGADVRHIQEFLGHSSLETTKIYLRMVPGDLREGYEKAMVGFGLFF